MKTLAEITLCKARSGRYQDTPENRRLHRVGQQYGGKKEDKEEELKGFAYTIKQVPDERHFEEMSDAELKRFRVFAYKCSIDFENLNKLTRQRCKQWADIAGTEIGSRNREARKEQEKHLKDQQAVHDITKEWNKHALHQKSGLHLAQADVKMLLDAGYTRDQILAASTKTEMLKLLEQAKGGMTMKNKYLNLSAGFGEYLKQLNDKFEKLADSSNEDVADEAEDVLDALDVWMDDYGDISNIKDISDDELKEAHGDMIEAFETFMQDVVSQSDRIKFDPKAFFKKYGLDYDKNYDNVEKSRSGVYINNAENRAKHRVGQHYGSEKEVAAGADDATYPGVADASPKNKREERLQRLENYKKAKATLEEWLQSDKMSEEAKAQVRVKLEKINQRIPALEKRLGIKPSEPMPATPEPAPQPAPEQPAEPEAPKDSLEAKLNDLFMRGEEEAFIKLYHQNYPDKVAMQELYRREAEHAESILPASIANMQRDMSEAEIDAVIREYLRLDPENANKTDDELKGAVWDFHRKRDGHYGLNARGIQAKLIMDNRRRAYKLRHEAGKRLFTEYLTSPEGRAQAAKVKEEKEKILLERKNAVATAEASFESIIGDMTASKFKVTTFNDRRISFNLVGEGNNEREISITNYEKLDWEGNNRTTERELKFSLGGGGDFNPTAPEDVEAVRVFSKMFGEPENVEKVRKVFADIVAADDVVHSRWEEVRAANPELIYHDDIVLNPEDNRLQ